MDLSKWLEILKMAAPIAFLTVPGADKLAPLAPVIVKAIGNAQESMKPGAEKKKIVITSVMDGIAIASAATSGKVNIDQNAAQAIASNLVDTIVDTTNRYHAATTSTDATVDDSSASADATTYRQ